MKKTATFATLISALVAGPASAAIILEEVNREGFWTWLAQLIGGV